MSQPPPLPLPNLTGALVGGYQIIGLLGGGAMGVVYLAVHPVLGRRAAVKVLRREYAASAVFAQRFAEEARAVAQFKHPNIVEVFDFATLGDGTLAIVMEYVDGRTLDVVAGAVPMPVDRALGFLGQLADALGLAHARGIVHRDVKAGNVMVTSGEQGGELVKLLDFGVAHVRKPFGGMRSDGTVVGTPHYMAPEQVQGGAVDARTDIYAMGILAWRLFAGKLPFDGTIPEVLRKQLESPLPPSPHVPGPMAEVLLVATQKDPAKRFGSTAEFLRELKAAAQAQAQTALRSYHGSRAFRESFTDDVLRVRFRSIPALREALATELANRRLAVAGAAPPIDGPFTVELQLPDRRSWTALAHVMRLLDQDECERAGIDQGFVLAFEPRASGLVAPAAPPRAMVAPPVSSPPPVRREVPRARSRRHKIRLPATCRMERDEEPGITADVSSRGLCVIEHQRRERGSQFVLSLALPNGRHAEIEAVVAWSSPSPDAPGMFANGLKIVTAEDVYFRFLQDLTTTRPAGE